MSTSERDSNLSLTASGDARRKFLERAALIIGSVSASGMLSRATTAAEKGEKKSSPVTCPDVKTPMKDVEGKVAFVTGGTSGIGLGIARAFSEAGMKVVIGSRTASHVDEAMKSFAKASERVHAIQFDVTDRPGLEKAAAEAVKVFGKVHVLVNNAGVALPPTIGSTSYDDWDWTINVNLTGPFNGVRAFLPLIKSHGEGGHIITTSSLMGLFAFAGGGAYTASKYAVVGMMEALRAELAGTNIGASVFCPGLVTSNITASSLRDRPAGSAGPKDDEILKRDTKMRNDPEYAMNPLQVGRTVLSGMRDNKLYILTSPEYERIMRDRSEALLAALPRDISLTTARAQTACSGFKETIYSVERDRALCGESRKAAKA